MNKPLDIREAGSLISGSGLADDVIQASEKQITTRRGRQQEAADDATEDHYEDADEGEELDDADDEDADDGSTHDDGEPDDSGEDDEASADEGEDADDEDDGRNDPLEAEYEVKVNGKVSKVKAKELVAGYQRNADYIQKTQALAQRGRQLNEGHTKVAEVYTRKLGQVNAIVTGVRRLLVGDMNSQEMQQLRHTDPQEWMVQRTLMQERVEKVDAVINGLNHEHERHTKQTAEERRRNLSQTASQEMELVRKVISDWDSGGATRLGSYLNRAGFANEELAEVTDSRMLIVAEKARRWDALQAAKGKEVKRKPKTPPNKKPVRPNATSLKKGNQQQTGRVREFERDKARARKTGDMRDAGRAIAKLL